MPTLQDIAPHNMTSNTAPSPYVASVSTSLSSTYAAWKTFDNLNTTFWLTAAASTGWLKLDTGAGNTHLCYSYSIKFSPTGEPTTRAPKTWTFEGSNNDSTWVTLDTVASETGWANGETRNYLCDTVTTKYRYFRLNITANNGDTYLEVQELYIYKEIITTQATIDSDTAISGTTIKNILSDTAVYGTTAQNILSDTIVVSTFSNNILSDTEILKIQSQQILSNADIFNTTIKSIDSDTQVSITSTKTIVSDTDILGTVIKVITSSAAVSNIHTTEIQSQCIIITPLILNCEVLFTKQTIINKRFEVEVIQVIPAAPFGVTITNTGTGDSVRIAWSGTAPFYNVYRVDSGPAYVKVNTELITDHFYVIGGLLENVSYTFIVRGANGQG